LELRRDCRHFPGDRPCLFHKRTGVTCSGCADFAERGRSVLVVKLEALGDVLRTTSVLPALHRAYDPCHITWVTSRPALDLFTGNNLVDEVLASGDSCLPMLAAREFDVVINPDAAPASCAMASMARADKKYGFVLSPRGCVEALNDAAEEWLLMGAFDNLKRENRKTYQQVLHDICELDSTGQHIVLELTEAERRGEAGMRRLLAADSHGPVVGVNTGAGSRWRHKKWRVDGFIELVDMLLKETDAGVMLLGGPEERERNARIKSHFGSRVVDACQHNLRDFIREVDLCDVVVTGDTLALHVALGLKKRVVALFGPTSQWEVDMYGLGQKVVPAMDCVCCYRADCDRKPSCMDVIDARDVLGPVLEELDYVRKEAVVETQLVGEPGR
jgi:ADP-heptose:LPS heptosyltransferase